METNKIEDVVVDEILTEDNIETAVETIQSSTSKGIGTGGKIAIGATILAGTIYGATRVYKYFKKKKEDEDIVDADFDEVDFEDEDLEHVKAEEVSEDKKTK